MKNGLGNLAASDAGQLTAIIKNRLKSIQYRPAGPRSRRSAGYRWKADIIVEEVPARPSLGRWSSCSAVPSRE
jgi:hypothetical protein